MALSQRKVIVAVAGLILLCGAALHLRHRSDFDDFLRLHGKQYVGVEYEVRKATFAQNELFVNRFNAQSQEVRLSLNWMADLSEEEYREMLTEPSESASSMSGPAFTPTSVLPAAVDWTQLGAVTGVKDQKSCGACYAFSATGAVESAYFLNSSQLISLSEQELVDCSKTYGNHGCHGGKIESALRYIRMHGIMQESQYPYVKYDHECLAIDSASKVFISDIIVVPRYDQMQLKVAVAKQPLAIALEADQKIFQFYQSGVLGRECGSRLTHAALLVGYGTTEEGVDYWLVKNSWGRGWGEHGYIRLLRTDSGKDPGPCGITLDAYYPII